jgi:hypothetical protein
VRRFNVIIVVLNFLILVGCVGWDFKYNRKNSGIRKVGYMKDKVKFSKTYRYSRRYSFCGFEAVGESVEDPLFVL